MKFTAALGLGSCLLGLAGIAGAAPDVRLKAGSPIPQDASAAKSARVTVVPGSAQIPVVTATRLRIWVREAHPLATLAAAKVFRRSAQIEKGLATLVAREKARAPQVVGFLGAYAPISGPRRVDPISQWLKLDRLSAGKTAAVQLGICWEVTLPGPRDLATTRLHRALSEAGFDASDLEIEELVIPPQPEDSAEARVLELAIADARRRWTVAGRALGRPSDRIVAVKVLQLDAEHHGSDQTRVFVAAVEVSFAHE